MTQLHILNSNWCPFSNQWCQAGTHVIPEEFITLYDKNINSFLFPTQLKLAQQRLNAGLTLLEIELENVYFLLSKE